MRYVLHACVLLALLPALARADVTVKDSTGATVTYDTTTNGSVHTGNTVVTDGAGTRQGTSTNPLRTDPTGTTAQPVTDNGSTISVDDGSSSLTVDGTVSVTGVATQTTLAAALVELQSILAKLNAALGSLGQTTMTGSAPVVIASNQTAIPVTDNSTTLSVDDGSSSLTVDGTVTANLAAGTNNIGDVDVLSLPALVAGSAAIGKLAANSGVDIGDVDVTSVTPPSTVYSGQTAVTTSGTEVTLGASQALTQGCWVKAFNANTGDISVGLNGVTVTTGYLLDAGESVFVPIANRTTVYIDATVNGEDVSYVCF